MYDEIDEATTKVLSCLYNDIIKILKDYWKIAMMEKTVILNESNDWKSYKNNKLVRNVYIISWES